MSKLITKIEGYRAPDGKLFASQTEALQHHFFEQLRRYTNPSFSNDARLEPLSDAQLEALWLNRVEISRIILDLE